jgi:gentisate 1,2-dioxygenase
MRGNPRSTRAATTADATTLAGFDKEVEQYSFLPHWRMNIPKNAEPRSTLQPMLWRWTVLREQLMRAGELITVDAAGRRPLGLMHPGLHPLKSTTRTLQMSIQLVLPGEVAAAHRHTMAAIRFVLEGRGAFTTVEGNSFRMEPGDLILTPNWTWHDHVNDSGAPIIWIDGLDVPFARAMDVMFIEEYKQSRQPVERVVTGSGSAAAPVPSQWYYKWTNVEDTLKKMLAESEPAGGELVLEYRTPNGDPTLPTIACGVKMLRPGEKTRLRRRTSCEICHVVRGRGSTRIDDVALEWESGDFFVIPNWSWHRHENRSSNEEAMLFFMSDRPILEPFGLYREDVQAELGR